MTTNKSALDNFIEKHKDNMVAPSIQAIILELARAIQSDLEAIKKG